jgi:hypothetical protein
MLLLFVGMLQELGLDRFRVDSPRHEVMTLVAKHANDFSREHVVEHCHHLLAVSLVTVGHRAGLHVLARPFPDLFQVRNKMIHRCSPAMFSWPIIAQQRPPDWHYCMICLCTLVRYMTLAAKRQRQPPGLVLCITKIADRKNPLQANSKRASRPEFEPVWNGDEPPDLALAVSDRESACASTK